MSSSNAQVSRYAIVLGLLTTIGPFAIDMYLPALPAIGHALGADPHAMQASLMAFFIAVGAGQLVAGPLSDMFGRRRPMVAGLVLFMLASIGCALAPDVGVLIALRFLQGLGACACMVTPRAVVRDLYTGPEAARMMSLLLMVYSVSPILAPLVGSFVAGSVGWHAVFGVVAALGLAGLAMLMAFLPQRYLHPLAEQSLGWLIGPVGYSLLHGGWLHLLFNCMWLVAFASSLVRRIGTLRFLALWITSAV
eukprot:gene2805-3829_t